MTEKAGRCRWCFATVAADVMSDHKAWHAVNDLHAPTCRKAVQKETTVHFTPLACDCGLE